MHERHTERRVVSLLLGLLSVLALAATSAHAGESEELARYRESARLFDAAATAARRGNDARARAGYRDALARDPHFVEAMVNLARLELRAGEIDAAHDWIAKAEAVRPDYPRIDATRGLIALAQGDDGYALESLTQAHERSPDDSEIGTNLGAALIARGRIDEARRTLEPVVLAAPDRTEAVYNLALAHDLAGAVDLAVHGYRRFLALSAFTDPGREAVQQRLEILSGAASVSSAPGREEGLGSEARSPRRQLPQEPQGE